MKKELTIKSHWIDLQIKLSYIIFSYILTFLICYLFRINIFFYISKYFLLLDKKFIFTNLTTAFWVYFQLCCVISLIFIIPLLIYFIFFFILKSFYNYQIKIFSFLFFLFYLILILILNFFYIYIFPLLLNFFLNFENFQGPLTIQLEARLDQYLNFFIYFFLFIFFVLTIPILFLIIKYFFINHKSTKNIRKYVYSILIVCFILISPPDIMLQLIMLPSFFIFTEFLFFCFSILDSFMNYIIEESRIRTCDEY